MNRKTFILTLLATIPGLKWLAEKLQNRYVQRSFIEPPETLELWWTDGNGVHREIYEVPAGCGYTSSRFDAVVKNSHRVAITPELSDQDAEQVREYFVFELNEKPATFMYLNDSSLR